jgi:hypothetical protein
VTRKDSSNFKVCVKDNKSENDRIFQSCNKPMDTEKELTQTNRAKKNLKVAAKISLIVLLLSVVAQFVSIYQTSYQLVSPIIPQNLIWEISKHYIFKAFILTISCFIGLIFYFYNKYLWLIILVVLSLIATRFVYLPTS